MRTCNQLVSVTQDNVKGKDTKKHRERVLFVVCFLNTALNKEASETKFSLS